MNDSRPAAADLNRQILESIASGKPLTQRSLAREMGVALGLTNLLVRRLVAKGYVKVTGIGTRHVRYLMTAAGMEALGRATRQSLENTVRLYTKSREQIRSSLDALSTACEADAAGDKPVIFYGAGDIAEIAFVSLQRTDLTLVGVVDDARSGRFFHLTIEPPSRLTPDSLGERRYSRVVVTSLRHGAAIRERLRHQHVPDARIFCL